MLYRITFKFNKVSRRFYSTLEVPKIKLNKNVTEAKSSNLEEESTSVLDEVVNESLYKSRKLTWADQLKNVQTVEEKIIKINMPKYYGYKIVKLEDSKTPYNSLQMMKHYTNTYFQEIDAFPAYYKEPEIDDIYSKIKTSIIDSIEFSTEYFTFQKKKDENSQSLDEIMVQQINRCLLNNLSTKYHHLSELELDINPRHEAFWWTGGVFRSKPYKGKEDELTLRAVHYTGKPYLSLRHNLLLKPFLDFANLPNKNIDELIPLYKFDPRTLGYSCEHKHAAIIPGYWPGNINEFGFLNYQRRNNSIEYNRLTLEHASDELLNETMHIKAIQSSFAWLFGQACYQGYSNFEDIDNPFSTQTIITNGKKWSFYCYQLNTTLTRYDNDTDNAKFNTCWGTKEMNLYETIDEKGKCVGFNENVLKNLIKFYANKPIIKQDKKIERVSDIIEDERREFLEKTFKFLSSNRSRNRLIPEIYLWEKIYKIDNNTRPLDKKTRFFELGINPFARRLDHHCPVYIPRSLRPEGHKSKNRWAKTYYP